MNTKFLANKSNLIQKSIYDFLQSYAIENQTIIIGLSGGPDSVALLYGLKQLQTKFNLNLIAAHLDHEWRSNSNQDVLFCKKLCTKLDIKFISKKASSLQIKVKYNGSQEEVGRKLRQYFFNNLAQKLDTKHVALAHHLDDQIETFMIRLIRGSSPKGLGCIQKINDIYIRPLLDTTKVEILNYLQQNNLEYLQDPSNESDTYLRNRIRKIIPELKNIDNRFENNFARTLKQIQTTNSFVEQTAKEALENCYDKSLIPFDKLRMSGAITERSFHAEPRRSIRMSGANTERSFHTNYKKNNRIPYTKLNQSINNLKNKTAHPELVEGNEHQINLKKLFTLTSFLQKQVIIEWLYQNQVQFTQSEKFIAEIFKFLQSPHGGIHQIHHTWNLVKKQNLLTINKSSDKF